MFWACLGAAIVCPQVAQLRCVLILAKMVAETCNRAGNFFADSFSIIFSSGKYRSDMTNSSENTPEQRHDQQWHESIYGQLHELAERALARESPGHSLQPTILVNDAYLRLLEQRNVSPDQRSQMMAAGATIIRRLLVDYARTRKAKKRGGPDGRGVPLHISLSDSAKHLDVIELNDALELLASENSRTAKVVELKFFGGLSGEEIAEQLGVSLRTVNNDWRFAKAWLYSKLGPSDDEEKSDE